MLDITVQWIIKNYIIYHESKLHILYFCCKPAEFCWSNSALPLSNCGESQSLSRTSYEFQTEDVPQVLLPVGLLVPEDTQPNTLRGEPQHSNGLIMRGLPQVNVIHLRRWRHSFKGVYEIMVIRKVQVDDRHAICRICTWICQNMYWGWLSATTIPNLSLKISISCRWTSFNYFLRFFFNQNLSSGLWEMLLTGRQAHIHKKCSNVTMCVQHLLTLIILRLPACMYPSYLQYLVSSLQPSISLRRPSIIYFMDYYCPLA